MPCTMETVDEVLRSTTAQKKHIEAMLCGIVRVLTERGDMEAVAHAVNWREAGVTLDEFMAWYRHHTAIDETRRAQEAALAARQATRAQAIAKLTPEERRSLGVFD